MMAPVGKAAGGSPVCMAAEPLMSAPPPEPRPSESSDKQWRFNHLVRKKFNHPTVHEALTWLQKEVEDGKLEIVKIGENRIQQI